MAKPNWEALARKWDKKDVLRIYRDLPVLLRQSYEKAEQQMFPAKNASNVIISGMGGSAIQGFILQDLFKEESRLPIFVENSYSLPAWANEKTLFLAISYSGKTEETLACLEQARKKNCFLQGISGNPVFEQLIDETILIPSFFPQTRFSFPALFASAFLLLEKTCIPDGKRAEFMAAVEFMAKQNRFIELQAQKLALELKGFLPVLVAPHHLKQTALKWTQDFNEDSKTNAFLLYLSEANHNQINAIQGYHKTALVFWHEENENPKLQKRREITRKILKKYSKTLDVPIRGGNLLEKTLFAAHLGALTAYFLALLYKTDSEPVTGNEILKKELAKVR